MVAVIRNPARCGLGRPAGTAARGGAPHPLEYAGRSRDGKRAEMAALLREAKQDAAVLSDPASIAWLLNIRGGDVPFTPFALGFALIHADGATELFMDPAKLPDATRAWLGNAVSVADRPALGPALTRLAGKRVRVDPAGTPVWFAQPLRAAGAVVVGRPDPCLLPKACKNEAEQQGARAAHRARRRRGLPASCTGLANRPDRRRDGDVRGRDAAGIPPGGRRLPRRELSGDLRRRRAWRDHPLSRHRGTNRPIHADEVYLIDSGAQYPGRHDRHHTDRLDRARPAAGGTAGAGHAGDARAISPLPPWCSRRGWRRAPGRVRTAGALAGGPGLRSWHRPRRRQLSVGP